jgi:hypothetical protein
MVREFELTAMTYSVKILTLSTILDLLIEGRVEKTA